MRKKKKKRPKEHNEDEVYEEKEEEEEDNDDYEKELGGEKEVQLSTLLQKLNCVGNDKGIIILPSRSLKMMLRHNLRKFPRD